jgi:hypothetical protein
MRVALALGLWVFAWPIFSSWRLSLSPIWKQPLEPSSNSLLCLGFTSTWACLRKRIWGAGWAGCFLPIFIDKPWKKNYDVPIFIEKPWCKFTGWNWNCVDTHWWSLMLDSVRWWCWWNFMVPWPTNIVDVVTGQPSAFGSRRTYGDQRYRSFTARLSVKQLGNLKWTASERGETLQSYRGYMRVLWKRHQFMIVYNCKKQMTDCKSPRFAMSSFFSNITSIHVSFPSSSSVS